MKSILGIVVLLLASQNLFAGRYYDAATGRFLAPDKLAHKFPAWSPYNYALDNPLVFIDPNGEFPFKFYVRSFHPSKSFGGGFHGDNRDFTTKTDVTSRIRQNFTLETDNGSLTAGKPVSDKSSHPIFGSDTGTPAGQASLLSMSSSSDGTTFNLQSEFSGNNPLIPSPNIDVNVSLSVTENREKGTLTISFTGMGDGFPNTELFVVDAKGNAITLGTSQFSGTPLKLIGGADTKIFTGTITIQINSDGTFVLPEEEDDKK